MKIETRPLNFAQFWYPDFIGIAYSEENGKFLICPYFDDKEKANLVYSKIQIWNPKFIRVRFIEYGSEEYAFIGYQNPKSSYDKLNFGLYRSSMRRDGFYSKAKNRLQNEKCGLKVRYSTTPTDPYSFETIGEALEIGDCKVIIEAELESNDYVIERWAHEICKGKEPIFHA